MPRIEVIPNSSSISAPGWAYVPDNGYDPSKAAIQPSARKRAARTSGLAFGDATTRQQNAVLKHLADLEKDSHRDLQITVPSKQRDGAGRGGVDRPGRSWYPFTLLIISVVSKNKSTPNVRRILTSQKTFANHLADEEAETTSQNQNRSNDSDAASLGPPHAVHAKTSKTSLQKRISTSINHSTPSSLSNSKQIPTLSTDHVTGTHHSHDSKGIDPLLKTYVPSAPSEEVMAALISGPPLSYNGARAVSSLGKPQRRFCEICGYWGTLKCMKCGARICGLECKNAHSDGRCVFYS